MRSKEIIGTVVKTGIVFYPGEYKDPIHGGVVADADGNEFTYTASECMRNCTTSDKLFIGATVYFGSVEPGKVDWISWRPLMKENWL